MATSSIIFLVAVMVIALIPRNHAIFSRTISKEEVGIKENDEKQTHLTLYYHDTLSGSNPTSIPIAKANSTDKSATMFGALAMMDDPLTEGPEVTSKLVGRAQGLYGFADQQISALVMIMNFYFLEGEFNGSTLSVLGRDAMSDNVREMPVVGGTGSFRFAKGYVQAKTHTFDPKTGDAIVLFDVYVNHGSSVIAQSDGGSTGSSSTNAALSPTQQTLPAIIMSFLFIIMFLCIF